MSFQLICVLVVLMAANQLIGTGYGSWKEGFSWPLFWRGVKKIFLLFVGYGAIALTVQLAADHIPKIEYLNGILLEPIAKYFTKVCGSLKQLLNESTKAASSAVTVESAVHRPLRQRTPSNGATQGTRPIVAVPSCGEAEKASVRAAYSS